MNNSKLDSLVTKLRTSGEKTKILERDSFNKTLVSLNLVTKPSKVEIHDYAQDFIHVLSGKGTLEVGGTLADKTFRSFGEWRGSNLVNHEEVKMLPGDIKTIPAGTPHRISAVKNSELVYLVVKNYSLNYIDSEKLDSEVLLKFKKIKALIMDVDGTMTDGKVLVNSNGEEFASFSRIDSWGLKQLQEIGIKIAMISYEKISIAQARGKKLKIPVFNDIKDKVAQAEKITREWKISFDEVCFVGDDLNDLPLLRIAGVSTCPSDAQPEVRSIVNFVLPRKRGENVIRFLTDLLIATQGEK